MRIIEAFVFSFVLLLSGASDSQDLTARLSDATVYDGRLVCLFEDGTVATWDAISGQPDYELASKLTNPMISLVASDAARLWAVDSQNLLLWDATNGGWQAAENLPISDPLTLVVVDRLPVVIYERSVELPTIGKSFKVPDLGGQLRIDSLRVLATYALGETLWVGTGQGEWGGHLVSLNIRNGKWRQYYDAGHYVTGISSSDENTLIVSWSMSHFMADTLIREHDKRGIPKHSYPELDDSYFQSVAFSQFDGQLYGVEQNTIVTIENGIPTPIAELGRLSYDAEPNAIGIAPAVHRVIPVGEKTLFILHRNAAPFLFRDGTLSQLNW